MTDEQTPAAGPSLLPCPFCGGELSVETTDIDNFIGHVECSGCDMRGPISEWKYEDPEEAKTDAVERWNAGWNRPHVASPASSSSVVQGDASGVGEVALELRKAKARLLQRKATLGDMDAISDAIRALEDLDRPAPVALGAQHSTATDFPPDEVLACVGSDAPVSRPAGEGEREAVALTVWYGSMPESNGKANWTAILGRKGDPTFDLHVDGFCFARSEYPDRVRYESDHMRWIIGELAEQPDILAYDEKAHSGYVSPLLSPAAPDAGGGWMPAADRPRSTGALWLALDAKGKLYPGVFVNHRIPESATLVQRIVLPALQPGGER